MGADIYCENCGGLLDSGMDRFCKECDPLKLIERAHVEWRETKAALADLKRENEGLKDACAELLKEVEDFKRGADIIAAYPGPSASSRGRYWWSGGTWLYPGQAIAVIEEAHYK